MIKCPKCEAVVGTLVIDSFRINGGTVIRRRRECEACGHRFNTREAIYDKRPKPVAESVPVLDYQI